MRPERSRRRLRIAFPRDLIVAAVVAFGVALSVGADAGIDVWEPYDPALFGYFGTHEDVARPTHMALRRVDGRVTHGRVRWANGQQVSFEVRGEAARRYGKEVRKYLQVIPKAGYLPSSAPLGARIGRADTPIAELGGLSPARTTQGWHNGHVAPSRMPAAFDADGTPLGNNHGLNVTRQVHNPSYNAFEETLDARDADYFVGIRYGKRSEREANRFLPRGRVQRTVREMLGGGTVVARLDTFGAAAGVEESAVLGSTLTEALAWEQAAPAVAPIATPTLGAARAPLVWALSNVAEDLIEAHPNSGLAVTARRAGEVGSGLWAFADMSLDGAPSGVAEILGMADRGASNVFSLIVAPTETRELWAAQARSERTEGPSMRAAPSWYHSPVSSWPRMAWKSAFGIKPLVRGW